MVSWHCDAQKASSALTCGSNLHTPDTLAFMLRTKQVLKFTFALPSPQKAITIKVFETWRGVLKSSSLLVMAHYGYALKFHIA